MTFHEESVGDFLTVFNRYKHRIRSAKGCTHLQLWRDQDSPNILFTYSHWEDPEYLEAYRHSETFTEVWPQAKALFSKKPVAWSVDSVHTL